MVRIEKTLDRKNDSGIVMKPLSELIKEARISVNLSQRAFARKVGITQAQLSRLENGIAQKPNRRTLQLLAPYLDSISYEDMLAMVGYTVDFTDKCIEYSNIYDAEEQDTLAEEFKDIKPELYEPAKDLYKYLDDPKNMILLDKIFTLIKSIGEVEDQDNKEALKKRYLRDCILNILQ